MGRKGRKKPAALILLLVIAAACIVWMHMNEAKGSQPAPVSEPVESVNPHKACRPACWLELPGTETHDADHCVTHYAQMEGRQQRNYTVLYDADTYISYWVAYPLCHSHMTTGREEIWGYDTKIPASQQTSVSKGYGASCPTVNYPKNFYARGHQIPNADRNAVPQMQAQTYYSTNMTPQLQNGFNGGIWAKLEAAVRETVPQNDTLYIVTGASFRKANENLAAKMITNQNDGKSLYVPNYYWKVLLKVKREEGSVKTAKTIGFWLPHGDLKGHVYSEYVVSVDQIEQWTGFDFFVNLPDALEMSAEKNPDWKSFCDF